MLNIKQIVLKWSVGKATVKFSDEKNVGSINVQAEYNSVSATYTIDQGELGGLEIQFAALRKMVSIQEIELKGVIG
jgi:hypothetical protein